MHPIHNIECNEYKFYITFGFDNILSGKHIIVKTTARNRYEAEDIVRNAVSESFKNWANIQYYYDTVFVLNEKNCLGEFTVH